MDRLIFNANDLVLLFTIYLCVAFSLYRFVGRRSLDAGDWFFVCFLLTQAAEPFHILAHLGAGFRDVALAVSPNLLRVFEIAYWLDGPLLLWYVRFRVFRDHTLSRRDLLYLLPAVLHLLEMSISFYGLPFEERLAIVRDFDTREAPLSQHLEGLFVGVMRLTFAVLCLREIRRARSGQRQQYSTIEDIDFGWLNGVVTVFAVLCGWAVLVSLSILVGVDLGFAVDFGMVGRIGNYLACALVTALVFASLRRASDSGRVARPVDDPREPEADGVDPEHVRLLEAHMSTGRPYLRPILTLDQLAAELGLAPRTVSQVINRHFGVNFFEYVNRYRVAHVKGLLADPESSDRTLIELMGEAGFNSKATFNTFFKKLEGCTPSEYRRQHAVR